MARLASKSPETSLPLGPVPFPVPPLAPGTAPTPPTPPCGCKISPKKLAPTPLALPLLLAAAVNGELLKDCGGTALAAAAGAAAVAAAAAGPDVDCATEVLLEAFRTDAKGLPAN